MNTDRGAMPAISVLSLGGTIASSSVGVNEGVVPQLLAEELIATLGSAADGVALHARQLRQVGSVELTAQDVVEVYDRVEAEFEAGSCGVVITCGTDTLEEFAFGLDLLHRRPEPIVVTGAMRSAEALGADGPANLHHALAVARSGNCRSLGVLVVMNEQIFAASMVRKMHASSPAAFGEFGVGAIGWLTEAKPFIFSTPTSRRSLPLKISGEIPSVALLSWSMGEDGALLDYVLDAGYRGAVVEGVGGGHLPRASLDRVTRLAERVPVILCSRTGAGHMLSGVYAYEGGELDLYRRGLLSGARLDGRKARILLMFLLAAGCDRREIAAAFSRFSVEDQLADGFDPR